MCRWFFAGALECVPECVPEARLEDWVVEGLLDVESFGVILLVQLSGSAAPVTVWAVLQ